jgi:peptidoglycan/LPS O-acetylase OafA/YrhL
MTRAIDMEKRFYPELESLRGIAALSVALLHISLIALYWDIGDNTVLAYERLPPSQFFIAQATVAICSRQAVVLFWVLSAFVMSVAMPDFKLTLLSYVQFVVRRFFRIMPAVWAATVFAILIMPRQYSPLELLSWLTLRDLSVVTVAWTLVMELAACLIFPFLLAAVRQGGLTAQLVGLVAACWIQRYAGPQVHWGQVVYELPLLAFYLGIVVPTLGRALVTSLPPVLAGAPLALAILAYMSPDPVRALFALRPDLVADPGLITEVYLPKLAVPLACWYLISWILYGRSRLALEFLTTRPLRFLGRVSYSLYLLHPPFLYVSQYFVMINIANPYARLAVGIVMVIPGALLLSELSYRCIERPGMAAGKRASDRLAAAVTAVKSLYRPVEACAPVPTDPALDQRK